MVLRRTTLKEAKDAENKKRQDAINELDDEIAEFAQSISDGFENRKQGDLFHDQAIGAVDALPKDKAAATLIDIAKRAERHPFMASETAIDTCAREACGAAAAAEVHVPPTPSEPHTFVPDGSGEGKCWACGSTEGDPVHAAPAPAEAPAEAVTEPAMITCSRCAKLGAEERRRLRRGRQPRLRDVQARGDHGRHVAASVPDDVTEGEAVRGLQAPEGRRRSRGRERRSSAGRADAGGGAGRRRAPGRERRPGLRLPGRRGSSERDPLARRDRDPGAGGRGRRAARGGRGRRPTTTRRAAKHERRSPDAERERRRPRRQESRAAGPLHEVREVHDARRHVPGARDRAQDARRRTRRRPVRTRRARVPVPRDALPVREREPHVLRRLLPSLLSPEENYRGVLDMWETAVGAQFKAVGQNGAPIIGLAAPKPVVTDWKPITERLA
jgi:hypothetical protein